ncbi:protein associated with UVRAG as autophagy enhancer isoform X2 [Carassius gibelio]|uniref:protein associated with UVRAG as autophagy enhancer isoform X2 n=1 Tax=Carassius gibelio TaxID=101364 RepID=UPI002277C6FD|nr:protein associated with UVRAG as autophagy enhancer isoform X2 [Carassius gibelio]
MANVGNSCRFVSWLVNSDLNHPDSTDDDDDDDDDDGISEDGLKMCECNAPVAELDSGLFEPEEEYHLPRSSPVISRKRQNTETEKQFGLSLTPPIWELSISPTVKSNCSSLHRLVESSRSEEERTLDHGVSPKGSSGHTQLLSDSHGTVKGVPPVSKDTRSHSFVSGRLHEGLQSKTKRRACSDLPPASVQRSSDRAQKHGSCVDHSTADFYSLDQENAHFVVVDMVLEMLEAVKWVVCLQQLQNTHPPHQDRCEKPNTSKTDSIYSFDSGFEDDSAPKLSPNRYSLASFQSCLQSSEMQCSAEDLAHHLVSEFRKQWFPSELLQNPDNLDSALQEVSVPFMADDRIRLTEEIVQKTRMRGTLTWAPPRFQIIFFVQPTHRRSDVIASQNFLCAGCGTKIEPRYMKKLRYCDYLGKYFCDVCHGGLESVIPGRVLKNWDFARYPVCHFSKQLLDSIWQQPLFRLTSVAKNLYSQAKELQRFRELQEQLVSIKKLLSACRLSAGVLDEFEQLPAHLIQELHLFSMHDLIGVKKGQLCTIAKALIQSAVTHIDICELCQARGFICEFCHGEDVLFPFQRDTCTRCQDCRACFHISCFRDESCPKCARLQKRKTLQEDINL